ncbi:BTAD domain-containing putative transcriptional regulator [Nocardia sp. NPDC051030]|uniref:BTAD domain-containing putative transcriptional regulator n=1 Tax=Nocardia sp. NPDC051030 TaxID=3155162 RepID=UPI003418F984
MADPRVSVLGPIQLSLDDAPIGLGATMLRAVLARLVVAGGRAVSVDRFIEDLWEGQPPASAVSVLQVHIHNLRRAMEPDRPRRAQAQFIVSESSGYALKLAPEAVDAWQFETLLRRYEQQLRAPVGPLDLMERRRALDAVLACWKGEPFEALTNYAWAAQEAARLSDLRLTAAELRAQVELELNRPTEVAIELRSVFDEHPEREECARLLATAQYRIGQQAQALTTLRRSREYLGEEYGIDPSPALQALEAAILGHSESLTTATPPIPAIEHRTPDSGQHNGYDRERATVARVADESRRGRTQLVWVSGEAGAGKTTLTESVLDDFAAQGWTTIRGGCPEVDGAPPAWAWAEIRSELDGSAPDHLATADPFGIARTVVGLCKERTAVGPLMILLEDAHRADIATLQVLRQVVNWLRREPVLFVITLRGSEADDGLHATVAALAHSTAEWLELTGLDLAATRAAARAAALDLSDDELELLHRRTGGNPLFIRETAKLLAAPGALASDVPDSIRELINHRLQRLPPAVTTALQHLAIWGEGVDLRILSLAAGVAEDELIDLIAPTEAAGLVRTDRTGRITFDHALIHDTVYAGIPTLRRCRMHWAALELLREHEDDFPGLSRDPEMLAHHATLGARSDTAARAVEYVLAAAQRCIERRMIADTARLWKSAIELYELAGYTGEHAPRAGRIALLEAHCALVNAFAYQASWLDAFTARDRAVALARELGGTEQLVRALTSWRAPSAYPVLWWPDPEQRLVNMVCTCLESDVSAPDRVRLLITAARESSGYYQDSGRSRRFALKALGLARTLGDPELLCAALDATVMIRMAAAEDIGLVHEMLEVAERAGLGDYRTLGHYALLRCALGVADLREAYRQAEFALTDVTDANLPAVLIALGILPATMALLRGDLSAAERIYAEFDEELARHGFVEHVAVRAIPALALGWARGDLAPLADRMRAMYAAAPGFAAPFLGMTLLATGDFERAQELYAESVAIRPELYPAAEYACRAYLALGLGMLDDLESLYRTLLPYAGTIVGLEGTGVAFETMDSLLAMLAGMMGDSERSLAHHAASEQLMDRIRADLEDLELPRLGLVRQRDRTPARVVGSRR